MNWRELNHRKNHFLRRLRMQAARLILDKKNPRVFSSADLQSIKHIVFLRNDDKLGDLLISQLAYRELKKKLPQAKITVIAGPHSAQLLKYNPHVDQVCICKRCFSSCWRVAAKLRKQQVDLFIDFDSENTDRTLLLLRQISPRFAFGFNRQSVRLYNITTQFDFYIHHITQWYESCFRRIGLGDIDTSYGLYLPEKAQVEARAFLDMLPHRPVIALNMFAASKHRCLSAAQIQTLCNAFPQLSFVLLGQPSQLKNYWRSKNLPANLILPLDNFSLFHSLALLQQSTLLLTPDTMWVHAACAFNKPLIALYKQSDTTNQTVWGPRTDNAHIIQMPDEFSQLPANVLIQALTEYLSIYF